MSVLAVVAKALMMMKKKDEMLRSMLVIAKGRSPKCSTAMKKRNQVDMDMKACNIVQTEVLNMCESVLHSKWKPLNRLYFLRLVRMYVYRMKNRSDTISAMTEAMAAPAMPKAGKPSLPNMRM